MKNAFHCTIEIQSPVHIGCDEVYEPTGFVIDDAGQQLIHFDPILFLSTLAPEDRERFSAICQEGTIASIQKIYQFFRGRSAQGRRVDLCAGFLNHYNKTLNLPDNKLQQELNKFSIQRTAFRVADGRPYLPGSSVKGALRTGYLNAACQGRNTGRSSNDIEKHLLDYSRIEEDPFGRVKVSDFQPVGDTKTRIVYAVNKKKKISDKEARGPYQILEVIQQGALFQGIIEVNNTPISPHIKKPIQLDQLLSGAVEFYLKEYHRENGELESIQIPPPGLKTPDQGGKALPLRIGRHSGAESVTIAGNRNIKIMKGGKEKPVYLDHATTLWLAANQQNAASASSLQPFGWVSMGGLSPEERTALTSRENEYVREKNQEAEVKLAQAEMKRKAEETEIRLAEERKAGLQRQQEETEKLEQKLEQMGPEERFIFECDTDKVEEHQVNAMYNRIDNIAEEFKKEIASCLATYWQNNNMWTKKDAANHNQWKKIRDRKEKLEQILSS